MMTQAEADAMSAAVRESGMSLEEAAAAMRRIAPLMPDLPVPSRWSTFKRWVRGEAA